MQMDRERINKSNRYGDFIDEQTVFERRTDIFENCFSDITCYLYTTQNNLTVFITYSYLCLKTFQKH